MEGLRVRGVAGPKVPREQSLDAAPVPTPYENGGVLGVGKAQRARRACARRPREGASPCALLVWVRHAGRSGSAAEGAEQGRESSAGMALLRVSARASQTQGAAAATTTSSSSNGHPCPTSRRPSLLVSEGLRQVGKQRQPARAPFPLPSPRSLARSLGVARLPAPDCPTLRPHGVISPLSRPPARLCAPSHLARTRIQSVQGCVPPFSRECRQAGEGGRKASRKGWEGGAGPAGATKQASASRRAIGRASWAGRDDGRRLSGPSARGRQRASDRSLAALAGSVVGALDLGRRRAGGGGL